MKSFIAALVVSTVALYCVGTALASEPMAPIAKIEIQAELKKLQAAVGAGEMSNKEYNARKKALAAAAAQQTGEAKK